MKDKIIFFLKILTIVLIIVWVVIVCYDFFQVKKEKNPKFCIYKTVHEYDDGTTEECVGLGYKAFRYKRHALNASEFGPIFISERQNSNTRK